MIMKQRSKLATLAALSAALDVNFSLFDALDDAEAEAKRNKTHRTAGAHRRQVRIIGDAHAR
jgi:hypothetical protein